MTTLNKPIPPLSRAADYFYSTAKPTVDEFLNDFRSVRRGRLAAIVLYHMADYWHIAYGSPGVTLSALHKALIAECSDFQLVRDVADASKHDILNSQKNIPRTVSASHQVARPPGIFEAPFGVGVFAEASIPMITQDDGVERPLEVTVRTVLEMWEVKLEQKSREALTS